jgi:hypothetical protein
MNHSNLPRARTRTAALLALLSLFCLLLSSAAQAGTPYTIRWDLTEEDPTCETAALGASDGEPFFHVNDTPLPTHEIPGALMTQPDGSQSNTAEAGFDSVLLHLGGSSFAFAVANSSGADQCVHSHNVVTLVSPTLGVTRTLFNVRRDGTAFSGLTSVSLSLQEINPALAQAIATLEVAITNERALLAANASKVADLAAQQSTLQQLDTELHDLIARPLDEIAQIDLDAILDRYAGLVDAATKAALERLINDLKQSVVELENELASLIDSFGAQADAVADLATQAATASGFKPDDPTSYGLGPGSPASVDIPDISSVAGAFSPGNDPYATYAAAAIAALQADVANGKVTARADFVANVRAWRANEAALQQALALRVSLSQAETNAFLNGQNSVTQYVQTFMDASDWFKDTSAPPELRAYVDGVLKQAFNGLSDEMKDRLNLQNEDTIDLAQTQLFQTISAFGGAMSALGDQAAPYVDVMQMLVAATERVGVGFVPFVGPALDLCECVTGKEWCLPSGKDLSPTQRVFSGAGVAIGGVAHYWAGVKNAGISPAAALIADEVAQVDEALAQGLHANPRTWYKTLRAAADGKPLNAFEIVAGRSMQEQGRALIGIGDNGVRDVLGMQAVEKAADFLTVTKSGKLAVSEVKGADATVDAALAVDQLASTMKALEKNGLAGDVERVELVMKNGVPFKDPKFGVKDGYLVNKLTSTTVEVPGFKLLFIKVVQL